MELGRVKARAGEEDSAPVFWAVPGAERGRVSVMNKIRAMAKEVFLHFIINTPLQLIKVLGTGALVYVNIEGKPKKL